MSTGDAHPKKFVLAENYQQFRAWCEDTRTAPRDAVFVNLAESIRGFIIPASAVVRYGTWYERKDIKEIEFALQCADRRKPRGLS